MKVMINDKTYDVEIIKKIGNKNTYLRVKDDLKIYVTTNTFVSNKEIEKILSKNKDSIVKMIEKCENKKKKEEDFYFLGKCFTSVRCSMDGIMLGDNKVFINKDMSKEKIDLWYKKQAQEIFKEHLDKCYNSFTRKIPYPTLNIRKMTTRWGVCNTRLKKVTLNLELIKKPLFCLDYVIMHELSHLIHANHSKEFWDLVLENCKDYKQIKKYMKE